MTSWRRAAILALALPLAVGCQRDAPLDWQEQSGYRWRALRVARRGDPGFKPVTGSRTGIDFQNDVSERLTVDNRNLVHGSGVALGDVDGDGLTDIFLARVDGPNALYRNLGDWRFQDVTDRAGVAAADRFSTGAVLADIDGDRDLDLLVTALGGPNALYLNDGSGVFTDVTADAGLLSDRGSMTMTLADIDGDSDLDLYVVNYKVVNALDLFPPTQRSFDQVVRRVGERYEIAPRFRTHYRVVEIPELNIVARVQRAESDVLYINDGSGRFARAPFLGRFFDERGDTLEREPDNFGFAARFYDVDNDGDPDLYVCNDFEDPDGFWINDGNGVFRAAPRLALRSTSNGSMAVDFADVNRDGHTDFFLSDMLSDDPVRVQMLKPAHTALPKLIGRMDDRPQWQRNTLHINRGDATFQQIAEYAGVEASDWSWGTMFLDVDLDGYEDLLIANGHRWDALDADTQERLRNPRLGVDWRREHLLFPELPLRNVAFRNRGDLTFERMPDGWGIGPEPDISHAIASADLDQDGDLDLVINRLGFPVGVFRNTGTEPRLAVRLRGRTPNTHGVGAKIHVLGGPVQDQSREVTLGGLYLSSSEPLYTFATGSADAVTIVVEWRSGLQTEIDGARPNRLYEIDEPIGLETQAVPIVTETTADPWFVDVSEQLRHTHIETPFDDYQRQPLLPNDLSRLGPGISWIDTDDDGDEDLVVPSGGGGRLALFRNEGDRFVRVSPPSDPTPLDQTTVLGLPLANGRYGLLVGQMAYEGDAADAAALWYDAGDAAGARDAVAASASATGPLAAADYDLDGDLDLFVGGRVIPGRYPVPASSRLLRRTRDRWVEDAGATALLAGRGMVSSAVFSDIDGDGDPDLILALEWGPLTLLLNEEGTFRDASDEWGIGHLRGRWNGVTTGDLDNDGRLDIVATNWGLNVQNRPTVDRSMLAFYGDFDGNGRWDVVRARRRPGSDALYPIETLFRLRVGIPMIRTRVPTFTAFANATLAEVLGADVETMARLEITASAHVALLNRGARFDVVPLPAAAQLAPSFGVAIVDLNGDGNEDVFLTQNFFPTEIETPRFDAGRGLVLAGDGAGGLSPVPGQVSGIRAYGDQRAVAFADYDGDARTDLAVTQNGAETKLYQNRGAAPGLRVRLVGPATNPWGIGAAIRVVYADARGPTREVHAGSGYWSQDGAVQVMGLAAAPIGVWVRWPGGTVVEAPVQAGDREVSVQLPE